MAWSNDYSYKVEGVAKSSASTSVNVRRATDIDGRRRAWCEWALKQNLYAVYGIMNIINWKRKNDRSITSITSK